MSRLHELARQRTLPEPAASQEAFGFSKPKHRERAQARQDLRRVKDPRARQFRRENPDADIFDWEFAEEEEAYRRDHPDEP